MCVAVHIVVSWTVPPTLPHEKEKTLHPIKAESKK